MKVLFFARFRQIIGKSEIDIAPPEHLRTVADLVNHLVESDPAFAAAFQDRKIIRAALDKQHVSLDAPLAGVKEIALFPPVTGG
jgi:sulfur-carrier protein